MSVLVEQCAIPEKGVFEINVRQSVNIQVTADEAQRKVHLWLVTEISNLIGADKPMLVIARQRAVWRVPAWIGFPRQGRVGQVGTVDVDVETGEIDTSDQCRATIEHQAQAFAALLPPYQPRTAIAWAYAATNLPRAPQARIIADGRIEITSVQIAK